MIWKYNRGKIIFSGPNNLGQLDLSGAGKTLHHFYSGYLPVECADLFTMMEMIVLHEKIILIGKPQTTPFHYQEKLKPFIEEGVFAFNRTPFPTQTLVKPDLNIIHAAEQAHSQKLTMTSIEDANYEVSRTLGAEKFLGIQSTPLLRNLHNFGYQTKPRIEHHYCSLYNEYRELAREAALIKDIDFRRALIPEQMMPIPPIALEVLQACQTIDDLPNAMLEVREKYKYMRKKYANYLEMFADPKTRGIQIAAATYDWRNSFSYIRDKVQKGSIGLGLTSDVLLQDPELIIKSGVAYITKDVSTVVETGFDVIKALKENYFSAEVRRLRPIHLTVRNYFKSEPELISNELSRLFLMNPTEIHRAWLNLASMRSNVWHQTTRLNNPMPAEKN